ncbi:FG-GAP repeat domain-containing protein [Nannocystis pusilla]|uniref:FG-GAP repeat domain-containing protein n=1 Tax=Nannocystis pusilla TaxID=889268 RepID=UPI003BF1CF73
MPRRSLLFAGIFACIPSSAAAAPWQIDPSRLLPGVEGVSQKVELVDLDADGFVDLVFADSRGSATGSDADAQPNQLLRNDEGQGFSEWPGVFEGPDNSVGVLLADLDQDGRDDAVVAVADPNVANAVLFGSDDPDGVPEDLAPPHIEPMAITPEFEAHNGDTVSLRARVHDSKIPARWHDFRFDLERGDPVHHRRLPYLEFAVVGSPDEFLALADDDPQKHVVAGVWYGEALWRFTFEVPPWEPQASRIYWRVCAIDAAGNQHCAEPSLLPIDPPDTCGDGVVDPWELCDTALPGPCDYCLAICGNCIREPTETPETCPEDGAWGFPCASETGLASCGDGVCEPDEEPWCPDDCDPEGSGDSGAEESDSATTGGAQFEDGCGCRGDATGGAPGLALLLLLGRRRPARASAARS